MYISNEDTICAIATPPGHGGIGVVRVSGPSSKEILAKLWNGKVDVQKFRPCKLYLGKVITPMISTNAQTYEHANIQLVDKVMAVWMPAPHTYTGQDVVEFSCHGSPVVLGKILEACASAGARLAGPGEFTRRAFLNGKIDLIQAEGVADLINATSERAARIAVDQLEGMLSGEIRNVQNELLDIRTLIEVAIDFPEEDIEFIKREGISSRLGGVLSNLVRLTDTYCEGRLIREGVRVVVAGRPNAGKSSILNCLVGCKRVIVHESPGTTRDVVEEVVNIGGVTFRFRDTAGVREGASGVEGLGIEISRREIGEADVVIVVLDGSKEFGAEDKEVIKLVGDKRAVYVINKSDLPQRLDSIGVRTCALTGTGIDVLKGELLNAIHCKGFGEGVVITSARHKAAIDETVSILKEATYAIGKRVSVDCVAEKLRQAQESLGQITGEVTTEELLDRIFSTFCIGK